MSCVSLEFRFWYSTFRGFPKRFAGSEVAPFEPSSGMVTKAVCFGIGGFVVADCMRPAPLAKAVWRLEADVW